MTVKTIKKSKEPSSFFLLTHSHELNSSYNWKHIFNFAFFNINSNFRFPFSHICFSIFFNLSVLFYFILTFPDLAAVLILSQSICCWASDSGCPTSCHVLFLHEELSEWWEEHRQPPDVWVFYPDCALSWQQMGSWCLTIAKFLHFFKGNRQRMCDISKIKRVCEEQLCKGKVF